jgi:PIN domain nuclease of toxin-antitoxin system
MNYLLDTHVFLWALLDTPKLSKPVTDILLDEGHTIFVSTVSFWEISIKYGLGKLSLENIRPEDLPLYAKKSGFELLQLDERTASSFHTLPRIAHCDPFDRMLIWQSINADMTIISKDGKFGEYLAHGVKLFWK